MQNNLVVYLILLKVFYIYNKKSHTTINFFLYDYYYYYINLCITLSTNLALLYYCDLVGFLNKKGIKFLLINYKFNKININFYFIYKKDMWSIETLQQGTCWCERELFEYFNIKFLYKQDLRLLFYYNLNYINYIYNKNLIYWCY